MGKIKKAIKVKKTSLAARACRQIQLYAKLRDTDANGNGKCVSCGSVVPWEKANGGHWQPKGRTYNSACLMEENVHFQCCTCNLYLGGNPAGYSEFMYRKYDDETLSRIKSASYKISDKDELQRLHDFYKNKNKALAKTKLFKINL